MTHCIIVTNRGLSPEPAWVVQRGDIVEDFHLAFGRPPDDKIHAIVLFTDNDQTKQPVKAYCDWARVHCVDGEGCWTAKPFGTEIQEVLVVQGRLAENTLSASVRLSR